MTARRTLLTIIPAFCALTCSDLGNQPTSGLVIQTSASVYSRTETIHFTVRSSIQAESFVTACNQALTYWVQKFDAHSWTDCAPVNIGPCLAIYLGYIVVAPGHTLSTQLVIANVSSLTSGEYRLKVETRLSGQNNAHYEYSNPFQISD
jgi:hypothetical protein